jgi:hypothetical protein
MSCFQFYLGGHKSHKGVLALDPKAVNLDVHLRPSQGKSRSPHKTSKEAAQNWKQTVENHTLELEGGKVGAGENKKGAITVFKLDSKH